MSKLGRLADLISSIAALLAGAMLILMVAHTILETVLRTVFSTSTFVLSEFVGYEVAILTALGLGHALNTGGLIRVNLLSRAIGLTAQRLLEFVVVVLTLAVCAYLFRYQLLAIETAFERGTRSNTIAATPLWIPMSVYLAGIGVFMLQLVAYFLRLLSGEPLIDDQPESS